MKKILWTVCFLTVVFTACKEEDWSPIEENGTLVINFTIQNPSSGPITRSTIAPEAGEENIKTRFDIFRFKQRWNWYLQRVEKTDGYSGKTSDHEY